MRRLSLRLKAKDELGQAEDLLCRKEDPDPNGVPAMGVFGLCLRAITGRITEVMWAQDRVCQAAGYNPPFDLVLAILDEERPEVRQKTWDFLKSLDVPEANPSPATDQQWTSNAPERQAAPEHFPILTKLKEPLIPEKAIEVHAPLRAEDDMVLLRLEALRPPEGSGYEVVIYRQESILVNQPAEEDQAPSVPQRERCVWSGCETIHSDFPTAEQALQQVLGFLEMRCRWGEPRRCHS
jgi:hypothetical protein